MTDTPEVEEGCHLSCMAFAAVAGITAAVLWNAGKALLHKLNSREEPREMER
jgi:hypothetical protein